MADESEYADDGLVAEDRQEVTGNDNVQLTLSQRVQPETPAASDSDYDEDGVSESVPTPQTFTVQPVPPYGYADTWISGDDTYTCIQPRAASELFSASDWALIESEEAPETIVRSTTTQTTTMLTDYSAEELTELEASGASVYAMYDDGTSVEVQWSDVEEITPTTEDAVNEAAAIAEATNQHFWHRTDNTDGAGAGAFVTDMPQEDFLEAAANDFADVSDAKPYHNVLWTALGGLIRSAKNNLVSFTRSATMFYDGLGNAAANTVASFGSGGARIGKESAFHSLIDSAGMAFKHATSTILSFGRYNDSDNEGIINFAGDAASALARIWGGGSTASGDYVHLDMSAGGPSVLDSKAAQVYAAIGATTKTLANRFIVWPTFTQLTKELRVGEGIVANGTVQGTSLSGFLAASNLTGTIDSARLPTVPVNKGGTGTTGTTGVAVTRTGVGTAGTFNLYHNGVVVTVAGAGLRLKTALASGDSVSIGSIDTAAYRPPIDAYTLMDTTATALAGGCMVRFNSNGTITLYNSSGSSIETGTNINFTITWAMKP